MIRPVIWNNLRPETQENILKRPYQTKDKKSIRNVQAIIDRVARQGNKALLYYTKYFEQANLDATSLRLSNDEILEAIETVPHDLRDAIDFAIENTYTVAQKQQTTETHKWNSVRSGIFVQHQQRAIDSVGMYVPRGRGSFPSMVYMMAIPAMLARVRRRIMMSPPDAEGKLDPACVYAAHKCKVHEIYRLGGVQAIAAMAMGTETIKPVHKILGPGSIYVMQAKHLLSHIVDVGPPTGPSESMLIADYSADPESVVLDLLVEAEHGHDSTVICLTPEIALANYIVSALPNMIKKNREPRRSFLQSVFSRLGSIIVTNSLDTTFDIANRFAPEHLLLHIKEAENYLSRIHNAGEILIGPHTTFTLANYATGANAILPTGGTAKTYSGLSVRDFQKTISVVKVNKLGYSQLAEHVVTMANYEDFPNHANAVSKRPPMNT